MMKKGLETDSFCVVVIDLIEHRIVLSIWHFLFYLASFVMYKNIYKSVHKKRLPQQNKAKLLMLLYFLIFVYLLA